MAEKGKEETKSVFLKKTHFFRGERYFPGKQDVPVEMYDRLLERGMIKESTGEETSEAAPVTLSETPFPENFPGKAALEEDGKFTTVEAVEKASDEELLEVKGIGEKTLEEIKDYLG